MQGAVAHIQAARFAILGGSIPRLRPNLQHEARLGSSDSRAGKISSTNPKTTGKGVTWIERKRGEDCSGKARSMSGNPPEPTPATSCKEAPLLKACASRQEKPPVCCKRGAASGVRNGDPHEKSFIKLPRTTTPRAMRTRRCRAFRHGLIFRARTGTRRLAEGCWLGSRWSCARKAGSRLWREDSAGCGEEVQPARTAAPAPAEEGRSGHPQGPRFGQS